MVSAAGSGWGPGSNSVEPGDPYTSGQSILTPDLWLCGSQGNMGKEMACGLALGTTKWTQRMLPEDQGDLDVLLYKDYEKKLKIF